MAQLDPTARDILIRTIYGEAAGEGRTGWSAVAHVLRNRDLDPRWPDDPAGVAQEPYQFSAWNRGAGGNSLPRSMTPDHPLYTEIGNVVDGVYGGTVPDPTGGATHYYAPAGMLGGRAPSWFDEESRRRGGEPIRIGGHVFTGRAELDALANGPPVAPPPPVASPAAPPPPTSLTPGAPDASLAGSQGVAAGQRGGGTIDLSTLTSQSELDMMRETAARANQAADRQEIRRPIQGVAALAERAVGAASTIMANRAASERERALVDALGGGEGLTRDQIMQVYALDPAMGEMLMRQAQGDAAMEQERAAAAAAAEREAAAAAEERRRWEAEHGLDVRRFERENQPDPVEPQWVPPTDGRPGYFVTPEGATVPDGQPIEAPRGSRPMTAEERAAYGVPEGVGAFLDQNGRPGTLSGGTTVNVGAGENAFEKELGSLDAKAIGEIEAAGRAAAQSLGSITELDRLLSSEDFQTGGAAALASWAQNTLGIPASTPEAELFAAVVNKIVPTLRAPGSGPMSDADLALFKQSVPALITSPEGNRLILDTLQAAARYQMQVAEIAGRVRLSPDDPNYLDRAGVFSAIRALPDPMTAFRGWQARQEIPDDELDAIIGGE